MRSASILVSLPLVIPQVLAGFLGGEHLFTTVIKRVQLWYKFMARKRGVEKRDDCCHFRRI
jgi:hypothetical protein